MVKRQNDLIGFGDDSMITENKKNIKKISYLTFECSTRCNMDCKFCFSDWRKQTKAIDTAKAKAIIAKLKSYGLKAINFTGGEPLLREDIVELLSYSNSLGLTVIISTNGILLKKYLEIISKYIDFIGLPLDSSDPKIHNMMRLTSIKNHHMLILELVDLINRKYPHIGIKINTMVSKQNKDTIANIGKLIEGKVVSWKLSQFVPASFGLSHKELFEITDTDYLAVAGKCKKIFLNINIIAAVAYSRDNGCRVLSSNGHLLKPVRNSFIDLGSMTADSEQELLLNDFDNDLNTKFFMMTYPNN